MGIGAGVLAGTLTGVASMLGPVANAAGTVASIAGLGAVATAGNMMLQQAEQLQIMNIFTNMVTNQLTSMASQQKTLMDAAAGVGTAYSNGAASLYGAIYSTNNALGKVFSKAGGH